MDKFIPILNGLINASIEDKRNFITELLGTDAINTISLPIDKDQDGYTVTQQLFFILTELGYTVGIDEVGNKIILKILSPEIKQKPLSTRGKILSKRQIYDDVYDISTEDGTFLSGLGKMIVHNTDSIFVRLDREFFANDIKDITDPKKIKDIKFFKAKDFGLKLTKEITSQIARPPIDIKYEKVFTKLFQLKKKRYIAVKIEKDPSDEKVINSGTEAKRRDSAKIVGTILNKVIDIIINSSNPVGELYEYIEKVLIDIFSGNIPISQFVISVGLGSDYKNPRQLAKMLAERITERDPGNAPQIGERINYVKIIVSQEELFKRRENEIKKGWKTPNIYTAKTHVKRKLKPYAGDVAETPEYVVENGLSLDYAWYVEDHIGKPILKYLSKTNMRLVNLYLELVEKYKGGRLKLKPIMTPERFFGILEMKTNAGYEMSSYNTVDYDEEEDEKSEEEEITE